ncbi:MAG: alpha/beta hydrolase [Alkalibacterium sp.]|nr:alpha/beta hydrolase [Alkalibacterium sp.]
MIYTHKGHSIYYEVKGEGNTPTLLFLHGVTMNHKTFDSLVSELEKVYRVILVDLPSHGHSSYLRNHRDYSKTCAQLAAGLLNHLNIEQAVFVGQSLGSLIVSHIAYLYPEKVLATVHIGGAGLYPKASRLYKVMLPFVSPLIFAIPKRKLFQVFARHKALTEETRSYMEQASSETGRRVMIDVTKSMIREMAEGLPTPVKQPSLIVYGDHEAGFVKRMSRKMNETLPDSRLRVISQAHHIANQDNPIDFNRELNQFIETLVK